MLPLEFTGKEFEEKIEDLRKELEKKKSAGLIVCMYSRPIGMRRCCTNETFSHVG